MKKELKIRKISDKGWFWIDKELIDNYGDCLNPSIRSVYACLCRRADNITQTCYPSINTIAKDSGVTSRTVSTCIKKLIQFGFIFKKKVRSARGEWLHNNYYLLNKSEWLTPQEIISNGTDKRDHLNPQEKNCKNERNTIPTNNTKEKNTKIGSEEQISVLMKEINNFREFKGINKNTTGYSYI